MEVRFRLNKKIPRDKAIIEWLSSIPRRERAAFIRERLFRSLDQQTTSAVEQHLRPAREQSSIDIAIEKFTDF